MLTLERFVPRIRVNLLLPLLAWLCGVELLLLVRKSFMTNVDGGCARTGALYDFHPWQRSRLVAGGQSPLSSISSCC